METGWEVQQKIHTALKKKARAYVTMKAAAQALGAPLRRQLSLPENADSGRIRKILTPHLGPDLVCKAGFGGALYIRLKQKPEYFVLEKIASRANGLTIKQVAQHLPLPKPQVTEAVNTLLAEGSLVCCFNRYDTALLKCASPDKGHVPQSIAGTEDEATKAAVEETANITTEPAVMKTLSVKKPDSTSEETEQSSTNATKCIDVVKKIRDNATMDDVSPEGNVTQPETDSNETLEADQRTLATAYKTVGRGRPFVPIHRLRTALAWDRTHFDQRLRQFRDQGVIELQAGNPTDLTPEERDNAFVDEFGVLFVMVNWWGG